LLSFSWDDESVNEYLRFQSYLMFVTQWKWIMFPGISDLLQPSIASLHRTTRKIHTCISPTMLLTSSAETMLWIVRNLVVKGTFNTNNIMIQYSMFKWKTFYLRHSTHTRWLRAIWKIIEKNNAFMKSVFRLRFSCHCLLQTDDTNHFWRANSLRNSQLQNCFPNPFYPYFPFFWSDKEILLIRSNIFSFNVMHVLSDSVGFLYSPQRDKEKRNNSSKLRYTTLLTWHKSIFRLLSLLENSQQYINGSKTVTIMWTSWHQRLTTLLSRRYCQLILS